MAVQLTPQEQQWLQSKLASGSYNEIINEANNRGITIGDLSQLTGYSPNQINSYSDAQRAQSQPIPTASAPTVAPTQQPAAYVPPSFESWFSSPEAQKMQTEQGYLGAKAYYDQNVASGRWGTSGPTDPYKGQSFASVDINGSPFARTGMSFDEMMIDPMRRGFMQQAGITANDFRLDPTHGWVTPFDKFHSGVEMPMADAKKGNIFTDVLGMRGGLGPILAGMGAVSGFGSLLNALAAGGGQFAGLATSMLPEGGFQTLFSSLGQNAAAQGGSFSDFSKAFGFDKVFEGGGLPDSSWGTNPRFAGDELTNLLDQQEWAKNFGGEGAINADGTINWDAINETMLNGDPSLPGQGLGTFDMGATVPVGGVPWEQLVQQYGPDVAGKLLMTSMAPGAAGLGISQLMSQLDSMGSPDSAATPNGTNVGTVPSVNGPGGINTGNLPWDKIIGSLINGAGSMVANNQFQKGLLDAINAADPFKSQRPFYQNELMRQYTDPNYLNNAAPFKNILNPAMDATQSRMASQGLNMSGNMGHELMKTGVNTSANFMLPLMDLTATNAGAKFGPGFAGTLAAQGAQGDANAMRGLLGSLGSAFNFAMSPGPVQTQGQQTPNVVNGGNGGGPNLTNMFGLA
jgi:hypothetical protein